MDTDYLTPMAYECIRLAGDAADVLRAEFGAACSRFRSEDQYLQGMLAMVRTIEKQPKQYLDQWNMLDDADVTKFCIRIRVLRDHIDKTLSTPITDRGEPEFRM